MSGDFPILRVAVPGWRGERYQRVIAQRPDAPIVIGRSETSADVWCGFDPTVSASACALIYAGGQWWIGNPHRAGGVSKLPIDMRAFDGRVETRITEGGFAALMPGESIARIVSPEIGWDEAIRFNIYAELPDDVLIALGNPNEKVLRVVLPKARDLLRDEMVDGDSTCSIHPEPSTADVLAILTRGVRDGTSHRFLDYEEISDLFGLPANTLGKRVAGYCRRLDLRLGLGLSDSREIKNVTCHFVVQYGLITEEDDARVQATWGQLS